MSGSVISSRCRARCSTPSTRWRPRSSFFFRRLRLASSFRQSRSSLRDEAARTGQLPFRPVVANPASEALLAHFAGREREDDVGGVRLLWGESRTVLSQERHHGHERDSFIAVNK